MDVRVYLPRPRDRGSKIFVNIRETVLDHVMNRELAQSSHQLLELHR